MYDERGERVSNKVRSTIVQLLMSVLTIQEEWFIKNGTRFQYSHVLVVETERQLMPAYIVKLRKEKNQES